MGPSVMLQALLKGTGMVNSPLLRGFLSTGLVCILTQGTGWAFNPVLHPVQVAKPVMDSGVPTSSSEVVTLLMQEKNSPAESQFMADPATKLYGTAHYFDSTPITFNPVAEPATVSGLAQLLNGRIPEPLAPMSVSAS